MRIIGYFLIAAFGVLIFHDAYQIVKTIIDKKKNKKKGEN